MTVEVSTIHLLDGATGGSVEAELRDAIERAQIDDWAGHWVPAAQAITQDLVSKRVPPAQWPQSLHWDWARKTVHVHGLLAFRGFSIVAQGVTQGLAQINLSKSARELSQTGKPLGYVEYLEVAPWNWPQPGSSPRLRGVGTALMTAAVTLSDKEGFKGRIGLHSLPQADDFYRRCGMTDLGADRPVGSPQRSYVLHIAQRFPV
jgi:hypothetical protein